MPGPATDPNDYAVTTTRGPSDLTPEEARELIEANEEDGDGDE